MKMTKQTMVPALLLGLTLVGAGSVAFADFTPGQIPAAVLSDFTPAQQAAITQAHDIRAKADVEARAVLTAAGVTEAQMHSAMDSYRDTERKAIDTALTNNDYAAFTAAIANSPEASSMTPDIFAKLVKIHSLEVSGDKAGAMALRKELHDSGFKGMGMHMIGGRGMGMGEGRGHSPRFDDDKTTMTPTTTTTAQ
jgi:hypothetical protein